MPLPTPAPSEYAEDNGAVDQDENVAAPENHGEYPEFGNFCALLDRLQKERRQEMRRAILAKWFALWRDRVGMDLYPLLRLLLPQKDRERAVYGLKEKKIAKHFITAYGVDPKRGDALHLLNWKKPTERSKTVGDFPAVLYEFVSKRSSVTKGSLRVDQVNAYLDLFATSKNGDSKEVVATIRKISEETTAAEQRWLVRIILKDLIISVKENTILSVFHPDALSLFNACSDLKRVAHTLWDPDFRLDDADKNVKLFRCFAPMLCKRPTRGLQETVKLMKGGDFIIEEKLDGERMQIHKRGHQYAYYSRKGKDYTYLYGADVGSQGASLTPWLDKCWTTEVRECILDGEMLVWDPLSEQLLPFGNLKTAAIDTFKTMKGARPCFKVFDVLFLNGVSLLDKKLSARKDLARRILKERKGRLEFPYETVGTTVKDIQQALSKVVEERGEGLVVKHPNSQYRLNGRVNDWIKVKPEYMDDLGETVDVLVVAGNYGSGKRAGGVSTLICAVRDDRNDDEDDDDNAKFVTFVRIGTGYSFQDLIDIRKRPWKERDPKHPPKWLTTSSQGQDDKGDVYLEPAEYIIILALGGCIAHCVDSSFIVKVKAAEITKSDQYGMKMTMRFPRCLRIRDDLNYTDCQTASSILQMVNSSGAAKRKDDTAEDEPRKKRKTTKKETALSRAFKGADTTNIIVTADYFRGMKFHVLDNKRKVDEKKTLETLIKQHGGMFCQRPKPTEIHSVFRVFSDQDKTPKQVDDIVTADKSDILRPSFIFDCIEKQQRVPLHRKYFFHRASEKAHTESEDEQYEHVSEGEGEDQGQDMDVDASAMPPPAPVTRTVNVEVKVEEDDEAVAAELDREAADSVYSEWMVVENQDKLAQSKHKDDPPDDSETEDEDEGSEAEWEVLSAGESTLTSSADATGSGGDSNQAGGGTRMGEEDAAMEYDPDLFFKHLCFYLDSPENAKRHGMMASSSSDESRIVDEFKAISKLITENGGKIVDLGEPKLTHVVIDVHDRTRLKELRTRTNTPKRRQFVKTEFIHAAVESQMLPDEDEFRP